MNNRHIVMVDEDIDLLRIVSRFLEMNGYSVDCFRTGEGVSDRILSIRPDLVILDLMLPGVSGLDICRALRGSYDGPILLLSALCDDMDEVASLNGGADDYLPKQVKPEVLLARVEAQLRRQSRITAPVKQTMISLAPLIIEPDIQRVSWNNEELLLSAREFDLLLYLARHAGEVLSRDRLYQALCQTVYDGMDRSLDIMVSRLRRKLPGGNQVIRTLRGQGYLLAMKK